MRALRHLFDFDSARRHFPDATLNALQRAIAASEARHLGEIVFAVEGNLPLIDVMRGRSARERAHEAFAQLRVWNTDQKTGVLVYVLLADRAIEIVADRGIAGRIEQSEWVAVCALIRKHFVDGEWQAGALAGIDAINAILARQFPANGKSNPDELPNRPVIL